MKTCTKCNVTKHVDEFNKHSGHRDGLRSYCKACAKVASAAWYEANKERRKAVTAAYNAAYPGRHKAACAAWRAANPERDKAIISAWRAANRERERARRATWAAANPEKIRINGQNRRARKREAGGKLSTELVNKLLKLQRGKCACGCKQPLGDDFHLDHIMPLALGGTNTDDNIQLLTATCNLQKHAKHPVDFMQQRGFLL